MRPFPLAARVLASVVAAAALVGIGAPGSILHAAPEPAPAPAAPADARSPLVPTPAGCLAPDPADLAFVGEVVDKDFERVRYEIVQLRAGSTIGYSVKGVIDVLYFDDAKFLEVGEQYLVGARFRPEFGALTSSIRPDEPLFGGNDVIGLEDTDIDCPLIDDPVRTVQPDGAAVDSGVLSPLFDDKRKLFATIGVPTAIAFGVIAALVIVRWLLGLGFTGIFALGRAAVTPTEDHRSVRVRRHRPPDDLPS